MCTYVSLCLYMCIYIHIIYIIHMYSLSLSLWGFLGSASDEEPICQCRRCKRHRFNSWVKEDPLEKGMEIHSLQYSCLENPMYRGDWQATVHRIAQSCTQLKWLSTRVCACVCVLVFPRASVVRNLPANAGDTSSIPGLGKSPGGRNSNPFQYSSLENSMDRGTWQSIIHGVTRDWTQLSTHTCTHLYYCEINEIYLLVVKSLQFFI